jgi:PAS domain S-box-containing protein
VDDGEERFRSMSDDLPVILWVADAQGELQFANQRYREYFGVALEQVAGSAWRQLLHPADAARYVEEFLSAVRERRPYRLEAEVRRADGRWRRLASHGELRHSATGEYLGHIGICLDVTDQRHLEEQLRQSQKLESIGRLAGGIAHDFNNLLAVILSCADSLRAGVRAGTPPNAGAVDDILAAATRAGELTGQLLSFARRRVLAPVVLDLNAAVRATDKLLRRVLGEEVELRMSLQPGLWAVRCDPGQIEQAILNLAINARDAMPGGGTLAIETTNASIDERLVAEHPFLRAGPHVRLAVRDTGQGMSPDVKSHVFEPFFTTKPEGKGTGLGLATVYGIVKQSQGNILVESEVGRGTTVELLFPRTGP